ncbi:hypothetical protein [Corynebacterium wankanglinii]|uniref:Uncharacterized protein n=1 Tax=Corynebacterium wankanglinii TaxID=2735136 RepID=A0A838CFX7_9CORY|nr:hypothetical protein [Corynebacterium wankanglinii]MBA1834466.1 hypothetical protein [Corynebacterium wankanglinii]
MRLSKILLGAIALSLTVAGCSDHDDASQEADGNNSSLENFESRSPDSPILGNVSDTGECDPQILRMDKERNTPHIAYEGQPGDVLTIRYMSGEKVLQEDSVELSNTTTSVQTGASIYNGDLDHVQIDAHGPVGTPGECRIVVK